MKTQKRLKRISFCMTIIVIFMLVGIAYLVLKYLDGEEQNTLRQDVIEDLHVTKSRFERSVNMRLAYLESIGAMAKMESRVTRETFDDFVQHIMKRDTAVRLIAFSFNDVVTRVVPTNRYQKALGVNVQKLHPETVAKVKRTKKPCLIPPFKSVSGGTCVVYIFPIENQEYKGSSDIMVLLVVDYDIFKSEIRFFRTRYKYALTKQAKSNHKEQFLAGDENVLSQNPVSLTLNVIGDKWKLYSAPLDGWKEIDHSRHTFALILCLLFSILSGISLYQFLIRRNDEKELSVMFSTLTDHVFKLDTHGVLQKVYKTSSPYYMTEGPIENHISEFMGDIFKGINVEKMHEIINKCIDTKQPQQDEFNFFIDGRELWYLAKLSYFDSHNVICITRDITQLKEREHKLEINNAEKDKFFSLIAHDLKNPIIALNDALKMLQDEYNDFSEVEKMEFIIAMRSSADNVKNLLLSLLEWSRVQTGRIPYNPEKEDIKNVVRNCILNTQVNAKAKNISLITEFDHTSKINIDINMIASVVRNLISNSIKFTPDGGSITIKTSEDADNLTLSVRDTGVGMKPENAAKLFKIDKQISSRGTRGETGTGLGLILSKEFIDKHKGSITVKSEVGTGSEFIITLPKK